MRCSSIRPGAELRTFSRALLILCVLVAACDGAPKVAAVPLAAAQHVSLRRLVVGMPLYRDNDDGTALRPFAEYLTQSLGVPVEIRVAEPYQQLPALLLRGAVDVAELPPLAYVRARAANPDVRVVATVVISGNPTYLGHLYVKSDSRFHSLADLQGARIGYVNPDSSSGYLFARDLLRQKGFNPDHFFSASRMLGKHSLVLDAVLAGDVDVGAAEDVTSEWLGPTVRPEGLRVIAKTERIPNDCVAARPGLDAATQQALLHALQELHPPVRDAAAIMSAIGVNGWIAADEARYDRVRAVLARETQTSMK